MIITNIVIFVFSIIFVFTTIILMILSDSKTVISVLLGAP